MFDSSSYVNPTPLAHADASRDVLPRGDNMLTKYQMIKLIDFCEVWFLPESVARVAAIGKDHHFHTPRH
ncbi:hypothetical protein TNCV_3814311 [Trichonephila clavipes]|nr:hypothetical protein TNCV_3814311 [Trichonephila clavipes]